MSTVLIVDDSQTLRQMLTELLQKSGLKVIEATNGAEAKEKIQTKAPDLVITDLVMPGLDGRTLAAHAARSLPGLRVLFVSGYAHDVMAARGMLAEGVELLAKPYSAEQLATRLRHLLQDPS